jgi:hypothetical protein
MKRTIMAVNKLSRRIRPEVKRKVAELAREFGVDAELLIRALTADFLSRSANERTQIMQQVYPGLSRTEIAAAVRRLERWLREVIRLERMTDRN